MKTALLLAGGKATRLEHLREKWAKACVPIGDTSPLDFLLNKLHHHGIERCWINLHYRPDQVREVALACAPPGLELCFFEEPQLLGTGGTLSAVSKEDQLPDIVVNAKMFCDFDFSILLTAPRPTLVLHPPSPLDEFGGFEVNGNNVGQLIPKGDVATNTAAVFTGICRPSNAWLSHIDKVDAGEIRCLIRHGMMPAMQNGEAVNAILHQGHWCEISTPKRVEEATALAKHSGL